MRIKFGIHEKERKVYRTIEIGEDELLLMVKACLQIRGDITVNYINEVTIDEVIV